MASHEVVRREGEQDDPSEKLALGVAWIGLVFVFILLVVVGSQVWRLLGL